MGEKKKIFFFIYQLGSGGAARTMLNLLNNIDLEQFEPTLITLNYDGDYEKYLKKEISFIKLPTRRLRSGIIPFSKIIKKEKPDIIFSTIPNYNLIAIAARLLSGHNAKNIVREAALLGTEGKFNAKLKLYGLAYRFSKKVVALSEGVRQNIIHNYKVNPKKIEVIYNPVDVGNIEAMKKQGKIAEEHQSIFTPGKKVIITAGRLVDDKDQATLISAFAKLNKNIPANLVILGEGELEQKLKKQVKALNLEGNVFFVGFQENPYAYFNKADIFVLSSKREGFGHVLTEALATRIPIISTDARPGAAEVLDNGKYGVVTPVGDPDALAARMEDVLNWDDEKRSQVTEKGWERAVSFRADKIVKEYEKLFNQTIDQ
ncbi:glycosyltransferase [Oceanobacillus sp. CFH 90083]|uniref:glycosyltransferase n=1 Tax=Oceanobacillus sp. CFH 90083 TaxID=2592336 RepID=UPI00128D9E85|nr:glycosyltransferase [Oceanobacillus sp. CFH 90083]